MSKGGMVPAVVAILAAAGVLLLACCGGLVYFGFRAVNSSAAPHVEQLLAAMQRADFPETYEELTTRQFRSITTRQQYADLGKAVATRLGRLQGKTLKRFNMQQRNARSIMDVTYDATFEKGKGTIVAQLELEGGQWRFASFRVNSPLFEQDLATETCAKCGAHHPRSAKFCPACGAAIEQPQAAEQDEAENKDGKHQAQPSV